MYKHRGEVRWYHPSHEPIAWYGWRDLPTRGLPSGCCGIRSIWPFCILPSHYCFTTVLRCIRAVIWGPRWSGLLRIVLPCVVLVLIATIVDGLCLCFCHPMDVWLELFVVIWRREHKWSCSRMHCIWAVVICCSRLLSKYIVFYDVRERMFRCNSVPTRS